MEYRGHENLKSSNACASTLILNTVTYGFKLPFVAHGNQLGLKDCEVSI